MKMRTGVPGVVVLRALAGSIPLMTRAARGNEIPPATSMHHAHGMDMTMSDAEMAPAGRCFLRLAPPGCSGTQAVTITR